MHMCCTSLVGKINSLNDKRYGDYKNPILWYMYVDVIWGFTKLRPQFL